MLLEGLDPEFEEPAEGDEERLSERMGALIAQRRQDHGAAARGRPRGRHRPRSSRTRSIGGSRSSPTGSSASRRRPATTAAGGPPAAPAR